MTRATPRRQKAMTSEHLRAGVSDKTRPVAGRVIAARSTSIAGVTLPDRSAASNSCTAFDSFKRWTKREGFTRNHIALWISWQAGWKAAWRACQRANSKAGK